MGVKSTDIRNVFIHFMDSNKTLLELLIKYCSTRERKKVNYEKVLSIVKNETQYFRSVAKHVDESRNNNNEGYFNRKVASDTYILKQLAKLFIELEPEYFNQIQNFEIIKEIHKSSTKNDLQESLITPDILAETTHLSLVYKWNNLDKFIGREKKTNELYNKIQKNKHIIINGIRGIGKTSLVQAYLTQHEDYYNNIAWITVIDNIKKSMLRTLSFSDKIKFSETQSDDINITLEQYNNLLKELSEFDGSNLIIFDNANNAAEICEIINDFNTCLPQWKVIFTTNSNIRTPKPIQLKELSTKDARSLFLSYYKDPDIDANEAKQALEFLEIYGDKPINLLLSKIKNIPLIIELLAKVDIADEFISLKELTEIINSINDLNKEQLKVAVQPGIKHPNAYNLNPDEMTPFAYIKTIFEKDLKILDEEQKQYLYLFSILPSVEMPADDLIYLINTEKTHFISVIRKLKAWLNFNPQTNSFRMDELHQFAIRETLGQQSSALLDLQKIDERIKIKTNKIKYNQALIDEYNRFLGYWEVMKGLD